MGYQTYRAHEARITAMQIVRTWRVKGRIESLSLTDPLTFLLCTYPPRDIDSAHLAAWMLPSINRATETLLEEGFPSGSRTRPDMSLKYGELQLPELQVRSITHTQL